MATTIKDLLRDERANVSVTLSLADLREFVNELLENGTATAPAPVEVERSRELMTRDTTVRRNLATMKVDRHSRNYC